RIGVLEGALAVAPRVPASVDRADAVAWLEAQLSRSPADVATVVFHSVFIEYLSPTAQARISAVLAEAGRRATARSPLAHLRMEPEQRRMGVRLTLWPDGQEKLIGTAGAHGHPVRWRGWS